MRIYKLQSTFSRQNVDDTAASSRSEHTTDVDVFTSTDVISSSIVEARVAQYVPRDGFKMLRMLRQQDHADATWLILANNKYSAKRLMQPAVAKFQHTCLRLCRSQIPDGFTTSVEQGWTLHCHNCALHHTRLCPIKPSLKFIEDFSFVFV